MQSLVASEVESGVILPRSDDEVATNIRSYFVAHVGEEIIGYVALHIHSVRLAEIRSLVVKEGWRGKGVGGQLVQMALEEGRALGVQEVLALTYTKPFFQRLGFEEIQKSAIPEHKIWQDCIRCKHFPVCNEVAMMRRL
ncbi:MAG: GNAT family N-acetyltransferase [Nitratiruptor sp.]|nr:GNAT family N-acetyltransferase [Nitratiruptor sp.]NPA84146.1 N-acetyltransferase [Campylobacterota bacterium]